MNRVPADEPAEKPPEKPAEKPPDEPAREPAPPRPATEPIKSYEGRPLPPDGGPEQDICMVHPAMARAHPFRFLIIGILLIGGAGVAIWGATTDNSWGWLKWPALVSLAAGAIWWIGWYVGAHLWVKLEISNKRTIRKEGIIRRHTSIMKVGYLGISSSGQDGIEIEVRDLPRPYELKSLIDNYRDM
ncbi:MAG: hypothetical protein ACYTAQ_17220 [Planctomycetota bacterium]